MNCTPIVRQYVILKNDWVIFICQKGYQKKRCTAEFKQQVVEAVLHEGLSYAEAERIYGVNGHVYIQKWERIYLTEGPNNWGHFNH